MAEVIYTIGHSNNTLDAIIEILAHHKIEFVVDVRAYPRSRRTPHFNRQAIESHLTLANIQYSWAGKVLGGYRRPIRNSPNMALNDANFRGFADHMITRAFSESLRALCEVAARKKLAILCSEANYQHCHRQFIADLLTIKRFEVRHIKATGEQIAHRLHPCLDSDSNPPLYNRMLQGNLFT